jgi:hypothetical protein
MDRAEKFADKWMRFMRTYLKIGCASTNCHARESGHPEKLDKCWIPICTGMTVGDPMRHVRDIEIGSTETK